MTTPRIAAPAVPSAARIPGGRFGNQPALDGLRAISVIAVILYHAGFGWMVGGFYGVEVFFVVSGFLITTLLIEERERSGGNSLGQFWLRRARRLLPALFTLLAAVALWAWMFGTAEQQAQLRSDLPWSIFYVANWGQIVGKIPYYSSGDPLLRHLWSLAVEEQWYLVWPLAFLGLAVLGWSRWRNAAILFGLFLAIWAAMAVAASGSLQTPLRIPLLGTVDRTNFMYLSSITRAGGLLLGAAAAYIWRPWRRVNRSVALGLEGLAAAALTGIVLIFCFARLNEPYTFQFVLPLVSLFSLIVVAAAVHPAAPGIRRLLSGKALVAVGRRSYGIYLWHWPIFVFAGADHASIGRVVLAAVITAVVSELCFRYIETPVRHGAIGRLWGRWSELQHDRAGIGLLAAGVILPGLLVVALFTHYAAVKPFDRAAGGSDVAFAEPVSTSGPSPSVSSTTPAGGQPSTTTVVGAAPSSTTAAGSPVLPGPS
ncbi:MAG: acyltransferase, partial [Ilumatobacteraceae bacterium]